MSGVSILQSYPNLFAKQSRKGCFRTLLGCDAKTEFRVATRENPNQDIFYVKEESECIYRLCCPNFHSFQMDMTVGSSTGGALVVKYDRPWRCIPASCKCCCFQEIVAHDGETKEFIGTIKESFYICVPQYDSYNESNVKNYVIHTPICCGCLPNYCAEGCCRVPFYIYKAEDTKKEAPAGKIVKVWGSLATELIGVHQFQCDFPVDSKASERATLMGATFLLNELYFKPNKEGGRAN